MNYQEFIEYQEENLPFGNPSIELEDIWQFDFSEFNDDLMKSVKFYTEALEHNAYYLNVPCSICFTNDQRINAKATVHNQRGMILWNAGLLLKQCEILKRWKEIQDSFSDSILNCILRYLDNHVSILHFQIIQHFTFYHEFAHIIQLQNIKSATVVEFNKHEEDIFHKHVLECDADEFASLFLGAHVIQYCKSIFGRVENTLLTDLISVFLSGLLSYAISIYPEDLSDFNIETGNHPHPIFRLLFISLVICEYVNESLKAEGINLEYSEILHNSIGVSSKLNDIDLLTIWQKYAEEMMEYFGKIRESGVKDGFVLAVDAWNNDLRK